MKKEFVFRLILALGVFLLVYQFALKPILDNKISNGDKADKYAFYRSGSTGDEYDVVVFGEEPDGIAAAVSAARLGARTLLLSQHDNLGGIVSRNLLTDFEFPFGADKKILNGGILSEFYYKLGKRFSPIDYESTVNNLVKNEKNLEVRYGVKLDLPVIRRYKLEALNITAADTASTVSGRIFIDATRNGELLAACGVPFVTGSEDLNLKDSYIPLRLNFEMAGTNRFGAAKLNEKSAGFYEKLDGYEPVDINTRIGDFYIHGISDDTIIVQGLEMVNIDVMDPLKLESAYKTAVREAKNFALFLSQKFEELDGWVFKRPAEELYIREGRHFRGLYILGVNEVLENAYFDKTVAMGSLPVQIGKFAGQSSIYAGDPVQYGIPIGSLITAEVDNLLMTGAKISYSSLAASSAGTLGTSTATGGSAGVIAAWCLINGLEPADMDREKDSGKIASFREFMSKQGFYLPDKDIKDKNASNWAYPALKELLSLGLVSGGLTNNYSFDKQATQADLAILLLNGVYRLNSDKYSLALDRRMRPWFSREELTKDKAAEILEALYDLPEKGKNSYEKVCRLGYINDIMQLGLKKKKALTMDDVFYLAAYNIKAFTGEDIKE
ncbi:MAG: FAD-dependent oxidoreductase [Ruminiclostridium sp.]|nr:FAD-dependent oxidoreductase [Ruminiclostridium sp.]